MQQQTDMISSSLHYLSTCALHQGFCYRVEVRFAAKEAMEEHQGSAVSLPIEDIIGQVDWAGGKKRLISYNLPSYMCGENYVSA